MKEKAVFVECVKNARYGHMLFEISKLLPKLDLMKGFWLMSRESLRSESITEMQTTNIVSRMTRRIEL